MTKNELSKLLFTREKQFQKAKEKRLAKTILAFSIVFFLILCSIEEPNGMEYVAVVASSIFWAFIHVVVNAAVFGWLFQESQSERKILEDLQKQLSEQ